MFTVQPGDTCTGISLAGSDTCTVHACSPRPPAWPPTPRRSGRGQREPAVTATAALTGAEVPVPASSAGRPIGAASGTVGVIPLTGGGADHPGHRQPSPGRSGGDAGHIYSATAATRSPRPRSRGAADRRPRRPWSARLESAVRSSGSTPGRISRADSGGATKVSEDR